MDSKYEYKKSTQALLSPPKLCSSVPGEGPGKCPNSKTDPTRRVCPSLPIGVIYLKHFCQYIDKNESYHKYILKGEEHAILSLIFKI